MAAPANVLPNYQLGDSLGKGAFGQVYRALNWTTGETVAVKQIQLSNIPKSELGEIMSEIDLLKNLKHPNIVKYKGFVKTREYLYIILEYCENGSLHNICKRFGKFPENLVAVYISQVLEGLMYLHDQGVIHRDIKGANILTNKDGSVKLADFGVATTPAGALNDAAVVGSPYWMAPEVIEQNGATTASDIWSVGCVVIELLEGKPPYHFLDPMPALFRIVQDDCPPIPDGASPIVKDFLYHCFQKDCNLRISAKKLLKHPWMLAAKKQQLEKAKRLPANDAPATGSRPGTPSGKREQGRTTDQARPVANYDDAVQQVQEWNEALKSPTRNRVLPTHPVVNRPITWGFVPEPRFSSPTPKAADTSAPPAWKLGSVPAAPLGVPLLLNEKLHREQFVPSAARIPEEPTDNWDDDFEEGISFTKLQALDKTMGDGQSGKEDKPQEPLMSQSLTASSSDDNLQTIRPKAKSPSLRSLRKVTSAEAMAPIIEDYSDIVSGDDEEELHLRQKVQGFKLKNATRGLFHPDDIKTLGLTRSNSTSTIVPLSAPPQRVASPSSPPLRSTALRRMSSTSSGSRPSLSPLPSPSILPRPLTPLQSLGHSRAPSTSASSSSLGRSDSRRVASSELGRYTEDEDEDYDDIFAKPNGSMSEPTMQTLQLNTRLSTKSWSGDIDSDEEDPFAEIDEGFTDNDLETNIARDKYARLCTAVNKHIEDLLPNAPDFQLREACDGLLSVLEESPEILPQFVSSHGMLAIVDVLEANPSRDVILRLLRLVNLIVIVDIGFLESFCLIGGIPVLMTFTSKKYSSECRLEASHFVRLLCHSSVLTLQMFISCRGLRVLVDLLDEDYAEQADLVVHALNGIGSVFELQSPTPKNDFCRMFIREGLLDPLSSALLNVMAARGQSSSEMKTKIIQILLVFCQVSQSDGHVRSAIGTRKVIRRLLRACELLEPQHLTDMLKAVKHLSMNATMLDILQNANAIEILVRILEEQNKGPHSAEISNHIFQTCYNLCRLNKSRQEEAAQAGIIPLLTRVIETTSPLKQFALPILCDLASAGKSCRNLLWQQDGLNLYLTLLDDPYFQVSALESIHVWLQDETARVEDHVSRPECVALLLRCFVTAKTNAFENLLDPLLKIFRTSSAIAISMSKAEFFARLLEKLSTASKAVVRLNLLRILRVICDVHPDRATFVERFGMVKIVDRLSRHDAAVLVRELAREIIPVLRGGVSPNGTDPITPAANGRRRRVRRTASETSVSLSALASSTSSVSNANASSNANGGGLLLAPQPRVRSGVRQRLGEIPWRAPAHSPR